MFGTSVLSDEGRRYSVLRSGWLRGPWQPSNQQAHLLAAACATITLILKGDPVPEGSFSLSCFCADGTFPQVSLVSTPVSGAGGKHAQSEDKPSICAICWRISWQTALNQQCAHLNLNDTFTKKLL